MLSVTEPGPNAPCPRPFNLAAHVLAGAQGRADKVALAVLGLSRAERWSYGRLEGAVRGTATGLLQAGFRPGDILLMRLGNRVDFPIAFLGAIAAGLVPVPSSAQLTAPEVAGMIAQIAPAGILLGEGIACPATELPVLDQSRLAGMRDMPPADYHMGDPDRPGYIVFTSGTSGRPRAVVHAHRAIWARRMMISDWYDMGESDRILHAGAFNWTFTLGTGLMDPWTCGATALIPAEGLGPEALPLLLKRHEATLFAAVPGVFRKILQAHPRIDLPRLRHGLTAGETLPEGLREAWKDASGTELHEAFGMSECSTFISSSPQRAARPGYIGAPQPGRRLALLDPDDPTRGPVARGDEGIIAVGRDDPGLMLGYHGAEAETQARLCAGWFLTGDLGCMALDGQIAYRGRVDDMMNAGGYRVSPLEVEQALCDLPGITELAVTDIEVKPGVRVIMAFYTGPAALEEAPLREAAAARLARYKQPRAWHHLPDLPRNPNGKLKRGALRAFREPLDDRQT
ncbi:class I adenylate-forming enzyme family protein [Pseudooceanicola sp. HF7]|uniref:class I adenylate-forming enzyme family protein n=1 Tax=Pseudooceanicola sp. HF7 TaxID=2721560 RepID=UPI00142FDD75|nr:class I adenylate-forming enzyme family protein [Pseudooceanicola sp. HF7]NIZ09885.1 acyl--CoA ligase [Pseudooceanicola sp. HF7]